MLFAQLLQKPSLLFAPPRRHFSPFHERTAGNYGLGCSTRYVPISLKGNNDDCTAIGCLSRISCRGVQTLVSAAMLSRLFSSQETALDFLRLVAS